MQDIIQFARYVDELGNIMVIELKVRQREKVLNVADVARNKVIHADDVVTFFNGPICQVRP